jgi:DNA-binding CsgD family transcriptional regulator
MRQSSRADSAGVDVDAWGSMIEDRGRGMPPALQSGWASASPACASACSSWRAAADDAPLEQLGRDVLQAGARGYVMKSDADQSLIEAVESLRQHKPLLTSKVTEFVLDDYIRRGELGGGCTARRHPPREREVIQLLAEGNPHKETASALGVSLKTIEPHRANIMWKLRLRSVTDLVRYAIGNKIVQP